MGCKNVMGPIGSRRLAGSETQLPSGIAVNDGTEAQLGEQRYYLESGYKLVE
ncbi:hypothetical protein [Paenibacillus ginsengarvi]|uniref:hypothetical protein n=1 Tax=Paenibacillus ginsengarvi TaxID=400777 RepID=UPI0018745991|nr:hypothetical protein [Paenibacillus ginsengarvi]